MNWFSRILGRRDDKLEGDAIFEQLGDFLNSDDAQNAAMPNEIKSILPVGGDADYLIDAAGEFGLTVGNPIPVNGPVGEVTYLSSLITNDGRTIWAHRVGSHGRIDIFEAVSDDGKDWFLLYFTPYHPRKSKLVPKGLRFREKPRVHGIFATNQRVGEFPLKLQDAIREWSKATLGIPLVSPELRIALQSASFHRPPQHVALLRQLDLHTEIVTTDDVKAGIFRGWTQNKLMNPMLSLLKRDIGYEQIDAAEVLIFCASMLTYFYLRCGPAQANHDVLENFHRQVVDDITTGSLPQLSALSLYQTRYREYAAFLDVVVDAQKDQGRHMTTLLMHVCERASHSTAQGRMLSIAANSVTLGLLIDEAFKFATKQAHLAAMAD